MPQFDTLTVHWSGDEPWFESREVAALAGKRGGFETIRVALAVVRGRRRMCRRGEKEWVALIDTTGLGEAWRVLTKNPEREALAYAAGLVPPARRSRAKAMDRMVISDE